MLVVNLFGSPSASKSTLSAYLFSQLKMKNINCELVTEFAKDKVWEENHCALDNQLYISGEQSYRLSRLKDKVDVVIVDSPLLLGSYYNQDKDIQEELHRLLLKIFNSYNNINFFLNRTKPYNPKGRLQTEEESNQIAQDLINYLQDNNIEYLSVDGNLKGAEVMLNVIMDILNKTE